MVNIPKGLKTNSSRSIKFDWETKDFEKNLEELRQEIAEDTKDILIRNAPKFAEAASKYTPPDIGKNTIDKAKYERPILILSRLVNGGYYQYKPTQEDINQLRKKMVYKVLNQIYFQYPNLSHHMKYFHQLPIKMHNFRKMFYHFLYKEQQM